VVGKEIKGGENGTASGPAVEKIIKKKKPQNGVVGGT